MIPAFEHHPNSRFLGFPMSQNRYAIPAWSYLLEKVIPSSIVEIGTSEGGMSCLLAFAARQIGATFDTFDVGDTVNQKIQQTLHAICGSGHGFHRLDCFEQIGLHIIKDRLALPGVSVLLCDGGNKAKEFQTFARLIKPGDVIAAHDFGDEESWPWHEIKIEDVSEVIENQKLIRFMEDVFESTGWLVCRKWQ